MRERCLSAVVKHVEDILVSFTTVFDAQCLYFSLQRSSTTETKTQELGYEVIGALILWIPVQLIANESTMSLIVGSGLASADNEVKFHFAFFSLFDDDGSYKGARSGGRCASGVNDERHVTSREANAHSGMHLEAFVENLKETLL